MIRFVRLDLVTGGEIAVQPSMVVWVRPHLEAVNMGNAKWQQFPVAGHCDLMLVPDTEESNFFTVLGTFGEVLAKLEGE